MATEKQIEANRRNALLSTGPTTETGKAVSRGNALQHGLSGSAKTRTAEKQAIIDQRAAAWAETLRPGCDYEHWLVGQVAVASVMIDTAEAEELQLRDRLIGRAEATWSQDRAAEAAKAARQLEKAPEVVRSQLRLTRAGAEWLRDRWQELGQALERSGKWNEDQILFAHELMGLPQLFRNTVSPIPLVDKTNPISEWRALVEREIKGLESLLDAGLIPVDEADRERALHDHHTPGTPCLNQNHRYLNNWQRKLTWTLNEFRKVQKDRLNQPRSPRARAVAATSEPLAPILVPPSIAPSSPVDDSIPSPILVVPTPLPVAQKPAVAPLPTPQSKAIAASAPLVNFRSAPMPPLNPSFARPRLNRAQRRRLEREGQRVSG